jgi:hypothetical protein
MFLEERGRFVGSIFYSDVDLLSVQLGSSLLVALGLGSLAVGTGVFF